MDYSFRLKTFYAQYGDWLVRIAMIESVISSVVAWWLKKKETRSEWRKVNSNASLCCGNLPRSGGDAGENLIAATSACP